MLMRVLSVGRASWVMAIECFANILFESKKTAMPAMVANSGIIKSPGNTLGFRVEINTTEVKPRTAVIPPVSLHRMRGSCPSSFFV